MNAKITEAISELEYLNEHEIKNDDLQKQIDKLISGVDDFIDNLRSDVQEINDITKKYKRI